MKRLNGEGTTYRARHDGRWRAAVTLPDGRRKVKVCRTRAEAGAALDAMRRAVGLGLDISTRDTVSQFMRRWLPTHQVAPTTAAGNESRFRLHIEPHWIGNVVLADLKYAQVNQWLSDLEAKGLSPNSIRLVRALLRKAVAEAMKAGLPVLRNEVALSDPPRVPPPDPTFLTADQSRALLVAAGDGHLSIFFWLALLGGARRGEILGLQWQDIDFERSTFRIRRSLYRVKVGPGEWTLETREPKAGSRRIVPMARPLRDRLLVHQRLQRERAEGAGRPRPAPTSFVVSSARGHPEDPDNLTKHVILVAARAGIDKCTPHLLRHSCATLLLDLGVDITVVAAVLGHNPGSGVTQRYYSFVTDRGKARALEALSDLLTEESKGAGAKEPGADPVAIGSRAGESEPAPAVAVAAEALPVAIRSLFEEGGQLPIEEVG